jgi:hypothetical protein
LFVQFEVFGHNKQPPSIVPLILHVAGTQTIDVRKTSRGSKVC